MNISTTLTESMNNEKGNLINRVPEITILFWIIKILTTGMGEAASDYISHELLGSRGQGGPGGPGLVGGAGLAMMIFGGLLVISLILQFRARRYVTWIYWLNIALISVFGTMVADGIHLKPVVSTTVFGILLAIILIGWYLSEKTLSPHSIDTWRREAFYWATVMATFALGTAVGDMTADAFGLGFLWSGIMFIGIMAIPALAYKLFKVNEVFTFWFAYVTTRPLGASFADWMDMPSRMGGLGWSKLVIVLVAVIVIIALVAYMGFSHMDIKDRNNLKEQL
jgi:uncharacterized membrane-anchored protein